MKILVFTELYPSIFNDISGIFIHEQMKALLAKGVEIKVINPVPWTPFPTPYISAKWKRYSEIPLKDQRDGIEIYHPRYVCFPGNLFLNSSGERMYRGCLPLVREIGQRYKFDIIHAHVALPSGYAAMDINRKYNRPLILTIHGRDLQETIFRNSRCFKAVKKVFSVATRVVFVSNKLKRIAENNFNNNKKFDVIHNGISIEEIFLDKSKISQNYKGKKIILSVSNLKQSKGIDLNIKAISQLVSNYKELKYLIIGDGKERNSLEKLASNLGIKEYVEFLGAKPHSKVMEYISICDIFSLPSCKEGLGVVYLEAMAHGKPTIGCKGEGIGDIIENGRNGYLVEPNDVCSLIRVLSFCMNNPQEIKRVGKMAKKIVLSDYTWEINAGKTVEIYKEMLIQQ